MKKKLVFTLIGLSFGLGCDYKPGTHHGSAQKLEPDPRAGKMWGSDLDAAQARAKTSGKLVFIDFTGSDWCPPCMALHDNVLTQPEFLDYAAKNLELVEIDFPQNKPIDRAVELANKSLAEKYKVQSFPTLIVMDAAGKILHRDEGYGRKKAKAFTVDLKATLGR
jgi:thiol-disulfide isomerase/thioredoxin|tara:strand:+ start:60 stop:554 length:495 start_codon:yes stop_codon:yes gene_type:complete